MTEEELKALYEGLSFPSPINFRRAVLRGGGTITIKEATNFVSTYSQRQVTAPRQAFKGKIISDAIDSRWAADLISYVSQPASYMGKTFTHVLVVQDIFSRKLWGRALKTAKTIEVTKQFEDILSMSERKPLQMNAHRGWGGISKQGICGNAQEAKDQDLQGGRRQE
jgi:hypothetical protein